jgi:hypothetical protein
MAQQIRSPNTDYKNRKKWEDRDLTPPIKSYWENYKLNLKAHDLTGQILQNPAARKLMEYIHSRRKELETVSYENRSSFPILLEDVLAYNTDIDEGVVRRLLSLFSTSDFGILKHNGRNIYYLTKLGDACLSDMTYRRNREKLNSLSQHHKTV